jgi:hypothetical protein
MRCTRRLLETTAAVTTMARIWVQSFINLQVAASRGDPIYEQAFDLLDGVLTRDHAAE